MKIVINIAQELTAESKTILEGVLAERIEKFFEEDAVRNLTDEDRKKSKELKERKQEEIEAEITRLNGELARRKAKKEGKNVKVSAA